jgi:hypothetical protein
VRGTSTCGGVDAGRHGMVGPFAVYRFATMQYLRGKFGPRRFMSCSSLSLCDNTVDLYQSDIKPNANRFCFSRSLCFSR